MRVRGFGEDSKVAVAITARTVGRRLLALVSAFRPLDKHQALPYPLDSVLLLALDLSRLPCPTLVFHTLLCWFKAALHYGSLARIRLAIAPCCAQGQCRRCVPCPPAEMLQLLACAVESRRGRQLESVEYRGKGQPPVGVTGVEGDTAMLLCDGASCSRTHHAAEARRGVSQHIAVYG